MSATNMLCSTLHHNLLTVLCRPLTALKLCFRPSESSGDRDHIDWNVSGSPASVDVNSVIHNPTLPQAGANSQVHSPICSARTQQEDAIKEFLSMVEERFPTNPEVHVASSQIISSLQQLSSNNREEGLHAIFQRVTDLFTEHVDLVLGLNTFLPSGYRFESAAVGWPINGIHIDSTGSSADTSCVGGESLSSNTSSAMYRASTSDSPSRSSLQDGEIPAGAHFGKPDTPPRQCLSISKQLLQLMELHFAGVPEQYAQIIEIIEDHQSERTSLREALEQLVALFWGCTYMIGCLNSCLAAGQTLRCSVAFEMPAFNKFMLVHDSTISKDSTNDYYAQFVVFAGDSVDRIRPNLPQPQGSLPSTAKLRDSSLHEIPMIAIFEDVKWLGGEHDGYLISHSWDEYFQRRRQVPLSSTLPSDPGNDALAQNWFTLGLLESIVEKKISSSLMLERTPTGDILMTSRNLPHILRDWRRRMRALRHIDEHMLRRWFSRAEATLKQLLAFLLTETRFPDRSIFRGPNYLPNLHMFAAIGEALMASMAEFQDLMQPMVGYAWSVMLARYPFQKLHDAGWCPFVVSMLRSSVCLVQYAATLKPHFRRGLGQGSFDHSECSRNGCSLNNIDPDVLYVNRHVDDACHCPHSTPPVDAVMQALAQGEIPVVVIDDQRPSQKPLDITCEISSQTRYVAVSHVWADGLGSTTEEGLPICQLQRLSQLTRRLLPQERGAFWMDALCVPSVKETRKQAIRLMAMTYKNAAAVLVIDAGIRSCSLDAPTEEKLLRVLTCAWMQRLWTLQEALLAQKLFFEFADNQLVSLEELMPWDEDSCTMDGLKWLLVREMAPMVIFSQETRTDPVKHVFLSQTSFGLGTIGHALVKRTTSRTEDETLAIASLLGVQVSKLLDVLTPGERMKILLLEIQFLPSGIIFSVGEKLTEIGFRWAPRSLLGQAFPNTDRQAICTPNGLAAKYSWVYFNEATFQHNEMWLLCHTQRGCFYLVEDGCQDTDGYTCNAILLSSPIGTHSRNMVHAVAVKMEANRQDCEYRKKVVLYIAGDQDVEHEQLRSKTRVDIQDEADLTIVSIT